MNTALTGTALTLHNLGVAAGFGGALFGQMAMHPAIALGYAAGHEEPPMLTAEEPAVNSDPNGKTLKVVGRLGRINIVAGAAIIALTAILNVRAGRSGKWSLVSRFLP